jgi:hypothetical protein
MIVLTCLAVLLPGVQAGANADYLRAAGIVAGANDLSVPAEGDLLEWANRVADKYRGAIQWVQAGNKQPVTPLEAQRPSVMPAEAAQAKRLGELFEAEVFSQIAAGNPNRAADALIDGLIYARRIQSLNAKSYEVGAIAMQGLLKMFDLNRRAFAEKGFERIADKSVSLLQDIPSERLAMLAEIEAYKKMPEEGSATSRLAQIERKWRGFFDKEERYWDPGQPATTANLTDLEIGLQFYPKLATVIRTKLRLLNATSRVLLFEIRNYKLPDTLAAAMEEKAAYDPAAGAPFFYGKRDDAYVLYSKGTESTGRIDLETIWEPK